MRQIALTFDDAPFPDGPFLTGEERARRIIGALREAEVREVAFFANPGRPLGVRPAYPFDRTNDHQFTADKKARLRAYAEAGHVLANHTATHPNLRDVTFEAYMADVAAADLSLRPLPGFRPWFRFPYLSEGETLAKRDAVRRALVALGYRQGYVTADSYDWRLDQLAREAGAAGQEMTWRRCAIFMCAAPWKVPTIMTAWRSPYSADRRSRCCCCTRMISRLCSSKI